MKYILFLFSLFVSSVVYSATQYYVEFAPKDLFSSADQACNKFTDVYRRDYGNDVTYRVTDSSPPTCMIGLGWRGEVVGGRIFTKENKCKNGNEEISIIVRSVFLKSVCYQGCVYQKPNIRGGCVSLNFETSNTVESIACGYVQTDAECDAPDGEYSAATPENSESQKEKQKESEEKQKELEKNYCKTGEYNTKDPYYTKCPNRDGSGQIKDPTKDGEGNPIDSTGTSSDPSSSDGKDKDKDKDKDGASEPSSSDDKDKDGDTDLSKLDAKLPTKDISSTIMSKLDLNKFQTSGQCPSRSYTLALGMSSRTYTIDYKKFCDVLIILGYIVAIAGALHAVEIVVRDI